MVPTGACESAMSDLESSYSLEMMTDVLVIEFLRASGIDPTKFVEAVRALHVAMLSNGDFDKDGFARLAEDILGENLQNASTFTQWMFNVYASDTGIPGWDNGTCSMDWLTYACFCNAAAKAFVTGGPAATEAFLSSYNEAVGTKDCDPAVLGEPLYSELGKVEEKASILPWVGAALVAALGLGWVVFGKKGR